MVSGVWYPPQHALGPYAAGGREPEQQVMDPDADQRDQHQRQPDRFEQYGAEWRGKHLGQRFDGGVEHGSLYLVVA